MATLIVYLYFLPNTIYVLDIDISKFISKPTSLKYVPNACFFKSIYFAMLFRKILLKA